MIVKMGDKEIPAVVKGNKITLRGPYNGVLTLDGIKVNVSKVEQSLFVPGFITLTMDI
jgi:hypothetical protein